jgi:hypothetical protein
MAKRKRRPSAYQLERAGYWKQMIAKWRRSGLSQSAFCRQHQLQAQQFSKWKLKIEKDSTPICRPTAQADFIEVKHPASRPCTYEIITPADYRVRVEGDCDPDVLFDILSAVSRSC